MIPNDKKFLVYCTLLVESRFRVDQRHFKVYRNRGMLINNYFSNNLLSVKRVNMQNTQ